MTRYYLDDDDLVIPVEDMAHPDTHYSDDDVGSVDTDVSDDVMAREMASEWYDAQLEPIQWTRLKVGPTVLEINSMGGLRREGDPFWNITKGVPMTGTPYTYIMLPTEDGPAKAHLVHSLVWKAFHGDVPPGWEVRHKPCVPMEYQREYPNELALLDIYPIL